MNKRQVFLLLALVFFPSLFLYQASSKSLLDQAARDRSVAGFENSSSLKVRELAASNATIGILHVKQLTVDDLTSLVILFNAAGLNSAKSSDSVSTATQTDPIFNTLIVSGATLLKGDVAIRGTATVDRLVSQGFISLTGNGDDLLTLSPGRDAGQTVFKLRAPDGTIRTSLDSYGRLSLSQLTSGKTVVADLYASKQALFTGLPSGVGVNQGSLFINPASSDTSATLLGVGLNGSQKLRVDGGGNLELSGNLIINGTTVCSASGCIGGGGVGGPVTATGITNNGLFTQNGASTMSGNVALTGTSSLSLASGNASIGGTLSITGSSNLQGNVSAGGALAVTGTVSAGGFSGPGGGLTGVNANQLGGQLGSFYTNAANLSGTLPMSVLPATVTVQGNTFNGASQLIKLDGVGKLPAVDGSSLISVNAATLGGNSGSYFTNASNIASGTIANTRLSTNVTLAGNTFNGTSQLVQLDVTGKLPILDGSALTSVNATTLGGQSTSYYTNATNLSSGILSDTRLSANIPLINALNNIFTGTITGNLFSGSGANLTALNGSNISSGTVANARLTPNVTLSGNTFNGVSQLVQLDSSGKLPALDGSALTNVIAGLCGVCVSLQSSTPGTPQTGHINVTGTIIGAAFTGSGANLTTLNGSNISSGTVANARLTPNVTLSGNTFNGASQLVQLDATGKVPSLDGSALTSLNATNLASGTVANARLTANVTLAGNTFNGISQLVQLDVGGKLTAIDISAATNINASNIATGTVANARLSPSVTLSGNTFNGVSQLVQLDGTGKLPALDGSALTTVNAATLGGQAGSYYTNATNLVSGTVNDARLSANIPLINALNNIFTGTVTGNLFSGSGASLTSLNGTNISSGTVANARLTPNVTLSGNTFNGASQLVQLDATAKLPAIDGSALTNGNATNLTTGTVANARLSTNVTLQGNTFNGASQLVQLDVGGKLTAIDASAVINLNANNIATGTLANARLTTNVTLQGNTFNGASQLVQLDGLGKLTALDASATTNINAANIAAGTLSDARLSANIPLLNSSPIFKAAANSTTAFQVQTTGGIGIFVADTTNSKVTVTNLVATANLTVNGHIITGGTAPTAVLGTAATCTLGTPSVTVSGTDTAGTVTVTTGGAPCSLTGIIATMTFANVFGVAPRVVISPDTGPSSALQPYKSSSTITTFVIGINLAPAAATTYSFDYYIVQ